MTIRTTFSDAKGGGGRVQRACAKPLHPFTSLRRKAKGNNNQQAGVDGNKSPIASNDTHSANLLVAARARTR